MTFKKAKEYEFCIGQLEMQNELLKHDAEYWEAQFENLYHHINKHHPNCLMDYILRDRKVGEVLSEEGAV